MLKRCKPRIISSRTAKQQKFYESQTDPFPSTSNSAISAEVDAELDDAKIVVQKNRMIYRLKPKNPKTENPENDSVKTANFGPGQAGSLDNFPENFDANFRENLQYGTMVAQQNLSNLMAAAQQGRSRMVVLPGIADDVEAYPCSICGDDRVFLTRAGLEKHAAEQHAERFGKLAQLAHKIQYEWMWRKRLKQLKVEKVDQSTSMHSASPSNIQSAQLQQRRIGQCTRCNELIDVRAGDELRRHLALHSRNDRYREELEYTYGAEALRQLCCSTCDAVFADPRALAAHTRAAHWTPPATGPARSYMCQWCAKLFVGIGALQAHKLQVHGVVGRAKYPANQPKGQQNIGFCPPSSSSAQIQSGKELPIAQDVPARVKCELCDLVMVRPSLLIRHMARVHSRFSDFSACVSYPRDAPSVPALRYAVDDDGRLSWTCCDQTFLDRHSVSEHRQRVHNIPPRQPPPPSASSLRLGQQQQRHAALLREDRSCRQHAAESALLDACAMGAAGTSQALHPFAQHRFTSHAYDTLPLYASGSDCRVRRFVDDGEEDACAAAAHDGLLLLEQLSDPSLLGNADSVAAAAASTPSSQHQFADASAVDGDDIDLFLAPRHFDKII